MLMKPMLAAAAEAVSVIVGSAQNGGGHEWMTKPVRKSQTMTRPKAWPGIVLAASSSPVRT